MNDLEKGLLDKEYDEEKQLKNKYKEDTRELLAILILFAFICYVVLREEKINNSNILLNEHIIKLNEELRIVYANCHHKNL